MFGYRFRTFRTGANRLTEGWKASIMSEIGVGDCMAERREWVSVYASLAVSSFPTPKLDSHSPHFVFHCPHPHV